jgi:hypothetical protein
MPPVAACVPRRLVLLDKLLNVSHFIARPHGRRRRSSCPYQKRFCRSHQEATWPSGTPRLPYGVAGDLWPSEERDLQTLHDLCGQTHMGCLDGSGHVGRCGVMGAWPLGVGGTPFGYLDTIHGTWSPEAGPRHGHAWLYEGDDVPPCGSLRSSRRPGGQPPLEGMDHLNGQGVKTAGELRRGPTSDKVGGVIAQEGTPCRRRRTGPLSHVLRHGGA